MNNDECWEKFQFRSTITYPHPIYKEKFTLEGLAADAYQRMERELQFTKEAYERLHQKLEWMTTQEMYRMKDALKAKDYEAKL